MNRMIWYEYNSAGDLRLKEGLWNTYLREVRNGRSRLPSSGRKFFFFLMTHSVKLVGWLLTKEEEKNKVGWPWRSHSLSVDSLSSMHSLPCKQKKNGDHIARHWACLDERLNPPLMLGFPDARSSTMGGSYWWFGHFKINLILATTNR